MNGENPYNQYRQNAVVTAGPSQLTEMLFTGAAKFIRQAVGHLEQGNLQEAHNAVIKSQGIFEYLAETLDEKVDVAFNLAHIYDYAYRRLIEANVSKDPAILREVLKITEELRDAWHEGRQALAQQAAAGNAGRTDNTDKLV